MSISAGLRESRLHCEDQLLASHNDDGLWFCFARGGLLSDIIFVSAILGRTQKAPPSVMMKKHLGGRDMGRAPQPIGFEPKDKDHRHRSV